MKNYVWLIAINTILLLVIIVLLIQKEPNQKILKTELGELTIFCSAKGSKELTSYNPKKEVLKGNKIVEYNGKNLVGYFRKEVNNFPELKATDAKLTNKQIFFGYIPIWDIVKKGDHINLTCSKVLLVTTSSRIRKNNSSKYPVIYNLIVCNIK